MEIQYLCYLKSWRTFISISDATLSLLIIFFSCGFEKLPLKAFYSQYSLKVILLKTITGYGSYAVILSF